MIKHYSVAWYYSFCLFLIYMYSKEEAAQLKSTFWTALGQYMAPILSAEGEKVTWLNYKTGEKGIQYKMWADNKKAGIGIELSQSDTGIQQLYYEQLVQLQKMLVEVVGENWTWVLQGSDEYGRIVSRVYTELDGVSIFKKEDWPQMISFFKPRLIALDQFWSSAKYAFETLR